MLSGLMTAYLADQLAAHRAGHRGSAVLGATPPCVACLRQCREFVDIAPAMLGAVRFVRCIGRGRRAAGCRTRRTGQVPRPGGHRAGAGVSVVAVGVKLPDTPPRSGATGMRCRHVEWRGTSVLGSSPIIDPGRASGGGLRAARAASLGGGCAAAADATSLPESGYGPRPRPPNACSVTRRRVGRYHIQMISGRGPAGRRRRRTRLLEPCAASAGGRASDQRRRVANPAAGSRRCGGGPGILWSGARNRLPALLSDR